MSISLKKFINVLLVVSLALVLVVFSFYGPYTSYKRNQTASAVDCQVVMVINKDNNFKLIADQDLIGLQVRDFVTLKADQREWKHSVDSYTYHVLRVNDWVKYCQSGERPIPWLEKIVK